MFLILNAKLNLLGHEKSDMRSSERIGNQPQCFSAK